MTRYECLAVSVNNEVEVLYSESKKNKEEIRECINHEEYDTIYEPTSLINGLYYEWVTQDGVWKRTGITATLPNIIKNTHNFKTFEINCM